VATTLSGYLRCLGILFSIGVATAQASEAISVQVDPPVIERRFFDPQNPPKDMPELRPGEIGSCAYTFGCTTDVQVRGSKSKPPKITSLTMAPSLKVTLWTPRNGTLKVVKHVETHREICEDYYAAAERIAQGIAAREVGRTIGAPGDKEATEAELAKVQSAMQAEFLRETATRCDVAQQRFDELTQDSRGPLGEEKAREQAVSEERTAYEKAHAAPLPPAS
jgi:hypothetical protein